MQAKHAMLSGMDGDKLKQALLQASRIASTGYGKSVLGVATAVALVLIFVADLAGVADMLTGLWDALRSNPPLTGLIFLFLVVLGLLYAGHDLAKKDAERSKADAAVRAAEEARARTEAAKIAKTEAYYRDLIQGALAANEKINRDTQAIGASYALILQLETRFDQIQARRDRILREAKQIISYIKTNQNYEDEGLRDYTQTEGLLRNTEEDVWVAAGKRYRFNSYPEDKDLMRALEGDEVFSERTRNDVRRSLQKLGWAEADVQDAIKVLRAKLHEKLGMHNKEQIT